MKRYNLKFLILFCFFNLKCQRTERQLVLVKQDPLANLRRCVSNLEMEFPPDDQIAAALRGRPSEIRTVKGLELSLRNIFYNARKGDRNWLNQYEEIPNRMIQLENKVKELVQKLKKPINDNNINEIKNSRPYLINNAGNIEKMIFTQEKTSRGIKPQIAIIFRRQHSSLPQETEQKILLERKFADILAYLKCIQYELKQLK